MAGRIQQPHERGREWERDYNRILHRTESQHVAIVTSRQIGIEYTRENEEEGEENEEDEDEDEHISRTNLTTRTPKQSRNMVPNVARLPSQSANTNDLDDDSIDDPSLESQHEEQQASHEGSESDVDNDQANRKLPATTNA